MFTNSEIEKYYDLTEFHYRLHWNLEQSRSLHYGYWDKGTRNFHEALLNTNKILAARADIQKDDTVLDAGCGIGGSALWLAKHVGCKVTGIALNPKQLATGAGIAKEENLDALVSFRQADFTNTNFEDNSFDIVWAIESVCHARYKAHFLTEAYRLLRPGGRLIMCDYFKKAGIEPSEQEIIRRWINGWAIDDIPVITDFTSMAEEIGFSNVQTEDATHAIMRSAKRMVKAFYLGIIPSWIYNLFHRNVSEFGKHNVTAAYYQYKGLQKGLWHYQIICATKN